MLTRDQAIRYFEDYLADRIADEDADALLEHLKADDAFTAEIHGNLFVDFLLRKRESPASETKPADFPEDQDRWLEQLEQLSAASSRTTTSEWKLPKTTLAEQWSKYIPQVTPRLRRRIIFVVCLVFLCWGIYGLYLELWPSQRSEIFAHLTGFDDPVWEDGVEAVELGDPLRNPVVRLRSGAISLKTRQGIELVLEGPAKLTFQSQTAWTLEDGFLSAEVPPLRDKLKIKTPQMTVNVLGTSFWLKANREISEVHLVRGRLKLEGPTFKTQEISAGDAFSMTAAGSSRLFSALGDQFVSTVSLIDKIEQKFRRRQQEIVAESQSEPALLVLFDFQNFGRELKNLAAHGQSLCASAKVEGCSRISGPASGKDAVAFSRKSDRIVLDVAKPISSFTLCARVRVDSDISTRCVLLASEETSPGSVQWMLAHGGVPVLNIRGDKGSEYSTFAAPPVFRSETLRAWKHLTVVYDAKRRSVDWYLDGEPLQTLEMRRSTPIDLGRASIGNWSRKHDVHAPGARFGLSEFRMYDRALAPEEVREMILSQQ